MKRISWLPITASCLLAWGAAAPAVVLDQWGTGVVVFTADCPGSDCSNSTYGDTYESRQAPSAFSEVSTSVGHAKGSVELGPGSGLAVPELKAEAYSDEAFLGSAFSTVFGVEGYTYSGSDPKDFRLDFNLSGIVSDSTPNDGETFIQAQVYLFKDNLEFFFTPELDRLQGADVITFSEQLLFPGPSSLQEGNLSFTLNPGQSVYLWARLDADARRDKSSANAYSTLTFKFDDPAGLTAASNPSPPVTTPEPGAGVLLGIGVLVTLGARRSPRLSLSARLVAGRWSSCLVCVNQIDQHVGRFFGGDIGDVDGLFVGGTAAEGFAQHLVAFLAVHVALVPLELALGLH